MYEATLVSDDTPFDRFLEGDKAAMSPLAQRGLELFLSQTRGRCINCHGGPELTDATVTRAKTNRLRRREGNIIDFGFNNIGVRPTLEDVGLGGVDRSPAQRPLSVAALAFRGEFVDPSLSPPIGPGDTLGSDGAFKVPGLRNVELTAPYFHNGGQLTLRQVIDFYSRGGDFQPIEARDGTEISPLTTLKLTEAEKDAFEAFLLALTDERVRHRRAPFDHPQLFVPDGHFGDQNVVFDFGTGAALDAFREIPAVGRRGGKPLPNFLE
jgi:cytochrome c peroxidase